MDDRFKTFTVLINRISRNIRKIKNSEMAEYDLKSPHISCLYYLYLSDGLTATELCEWCEEDKATISRSLQYLEKNGYIFCNSKSAKRYKSTLLLTDKGRSAASKISEKIDFAFREVGASLSDAERTEFYRCLAVVSDRLDEFLKNSSSHC